MKRTLRSLLSPLALVATVVISAAFAASALAQNSGVYRLNVLLDGQPIHWDPGEGVTRNGDLIVIDDTAAPLLVYFDGGWLELNLADFGTFAQPEVTGMRFLRGSDPSVMSMGATVRHADKGFDDYTDTIVFDGAENGRLTLTEPLGEDGAFTRSKDNVTATGQVRVSALDNVRSGEGSAIVVDFSQAPFAQLERGNLRYELTREPEAE